MSRYLRGAALAALTVAASCAFASAASAQDYGRLVVFGDSLSDNGNLYLATGGTQPPSPPYVDGRFSTGPTFVELLGFNLGRYAAGAPVTGSIDYAFGGARTDMTLSPPGMQLQLAAYLGAGGTFGQNDLVSVLGGANNIFQGLPAAGASSNPTGSIAPVAVSAAGDEVSLVNTIAGAGAGTILVTNLPQLSLTPQFAGSPAAPLADYAVGQFNGALSASLTGVAAANPNSNIIVMDLYKVGATIAGNPSAFGITNITGSCIDPVTFAVCTDSGHFYTDGVHPTALGHRLIAALATDYLYYGDQGAHTTVQGETSYRHREDGLETATEGFSGREAWASGTAVTVSGMGDRTDTDARGSVGEAESDGYGVRIALESGPSDRLRFGLAGSYRNADVDVTTGRFDLDSFALDAYAGWRSDALFVNAAAGVAMDDFKDIERDSQLAPIVQTGSTDGFSTGARIQAGLWFDRGGIALSPRAAITWVSSDVDGYAEQGPAASYQYQDRKVEAISGEVTLRAEGDAGPFNFYVEGGYRDSLDDSSEAVWVGIAGSPAQVLSRDFEEPFGGQILASAGLEGMLFEHVKVNVGYRGRFGDEADSNMGVISFTLPL